MKKTIKSSSYSASLIIGLLVTVFSIPGFAQQQTLAQQLAADPSNTALIIELAQDTNVSQDDITLALSEAAETLAAQGDIENAGALAIQAVNRAQSSGNASLISTVGERASAISSTALDRGNASLASDITTQVAIGRSTDLAMAFVNAGGSAGRVIQAGGAYVALATDINGNQVGVTVSVNDTSDIEQQPDGSIRIVAPPPQEPTVPIIPEPNPSQAGSPT